MRKAPIALAVLAVIGFWHARATLLTYLLVAALTASPHAPVRGWRRHPPPEMEAET
jgi:hypothetical protein